MARRHADTTPSARLLLTKKWGAASRFRSLGDALLFIETEGTAPSGFHVGFWLSTFGLDADTVRELQRSLDEVVTKLVEPGVAATL